MLDLFCGVGGFALHCAGPGRSITGVEISEQAIASAQLSAREAGIDARFTVGDATAATADADVVIVNPPRRGIGSLAGTLDASSVEYVLYSSCHPVSLARDLRAMPHFEPLRGRIFDMFPQTDHVETLVLAKRRG